MEACFTFKIEKNLVPFVGKVSNRCIQGLFLHKDERLIEAVKLLMGEDIVHISHRYMTKMEIYSLIAAWGLEFEDTMAKVKNVLNDLIVEDYLGDMESIFEWAILRVGINISGGSIEHVNPILFVHWPEDDMKERCKALTWRGWEAFKTFVGLLWVEEALRMVHKIARVEVG